MNTMVAISVGVALLYAVCLVIWKLWHRYEINPEEYDDIAKALAEYPDLSKYLLTFKTDACITKAEKRRIMQEYHARRRRSATRQELERRKSLILKHMEDT